jgi:tight adherence protein C
MIGLVAGVFVATLLLFAAAVEMLRGRRAQGKPAIPQKLVSTLGTLARPADSSQGDVLRVRLQQAGWRGARAVEIFLAFQGVLTLALPALGWVVFRSSWFPGRLALAVGLAGVGYYFPVAILSLRRGRRQTRLRSAFPNALDMLVSCLEAGHGLDVAFRHLGSEMASSSPDFGREISLVNTELAAGISRMEALRHMHARTGLEEIGSLVNELSQAERYGTQIAAALRSHAHLTRTRRILEAERKAAEATPKLTVVMILFVLPPLFIVLVGPTVVNLVERFFPATQAAL